jgi:guanylate kinase
MTGVIGNVKEGSIFVISGPAGTGKTTLTQMLVDEFPCITVSISFTTRKMRNNEAQGVHYNFIDKAEFEQKIASDDLLEFAQIYGEYYGTSKSWVEKQRKGGKHVVLVIDTQGALKIKKFVDAVFIFIMPPSLEALRTRLENRNTETAEVITKRLNWATNEIETGKKEYQYIVVNKHLDTAYQVLRSIFIAEEHRAKNYRN